MSSEGFHEPLDLLSETTKERHRAIVSLIEELEAIDWYQQRAEACTDAELRAVLLHHREEEVEHAMMNLEWLRRNDPVFREKIAVYVNSEGPITAIEAAEEAASPGKPKGGLAAEAQGSQGRSGDSSTPAGLGHGPSLAIGSLRRT